MRWIIGIVAAAVIAVVTLPLALILPSVLPRDSGFTARSAEGRIWYGVLRDARLSGMPIGDTIVGLDPLALFTGEALLGFRSNAARGLLSASSGRFGVAALNGSFVPTRFAPLPLGRVTLTDVAVQFAGARCLSASGRVQADVAGDLGGLQLPGGLSGQIRCDGDALLVPLVGQSGLERIDLRIVGTGHWRAELAVKPGDPALTAKLAAAGFQPGNAGMTLRIAGQL